MLSLDKITYSVGSKKLLEDISVEIPVGQIVVIMGPNGAGKTTLLKSISNEIECKGKVTFKGKYIKKWKYKEKAPHIAVFSQQNSDSIPLAVDEIVLMGRYPYFGNIPTKKDFEVSNNNIKKTDIADLKKQQYNTLSGGEKQRTHLARVFSQLDDNGIKNKLLLLDEPFNNLDVYHQYKIMERVRDFVKEGNTAIVVLHDLNVASQFADTVLLMKNGTILGKGTPQEIFTREYIQEAYNYPCEIIENPVTKTPMVVFGN